MRLLVKYLVATVALFAMSAATACHAQTLDFDDVISQALAHAYDLKLAVVDSKIAKTDIKHARADYFPQARLQLNSERLNDLSSNRQQQVAVVGTSVLPNATLFQDTLVLNSTLTLWDFGVRRSTLNAVSKHAEAATLMPAWRTREIQVQVIELYANALITYKELSAKRQTLALRQELFGIKRRLYEAGTLSKVEVAEQAIDVARTLDEINELKQRLVSDLKELSTFTHIAYDVNEVEVRDFSDESPITPLFDAQATPEYKYYKLEIEKKKNELKALRRQLLPQVGLYSYYIFYGSNPNNFGRAISSFGQRTVSLGISVSMPLFDGLRNQSDQAKKKLEIQRLAIEQDQKLWQLRQQYEKASAHAALYGVQMSTKAVLLSNGQEKAGMQQRLSEQQIVNRTAWLNEQVQVIDHQLRLDKAAVQKLASLKKLRVLTGA
jgi:outer membrane protein